jgi:hypothetical protein
MLLISNLCSLFNVTVWANFFQIWLTAWIEIWSHTPYTLHTRSVFPLSFWGWTIFCKSIFPELWKILSCIFWRWMFAVTDVTLKSYIDHSDFWSGRWTKEKHFLTSWLIKIEQQLRKWAKTSVLVFTTEYLSYRTQNNIFESLVSFLLWTYLFYMCARNKLVRI